MKTLFYLLTCGCFILAACNGNVGHNAAAIDTIKAKTVNGKDVAITFEEPTHDFGEITQGEKVEYSFKYTNTGKADVIIEDAISSCGCTVPEWPKDPLKPGQSGYIKVIFDSAGKEGYTQKEVSLRLNDGRGFQVGPVIRCNIIRK